MKQAVLITGIIALALMIVMGCSSHPQLSDKPVKPAPQLSETLAWQSMDKRPGWTVSEPEMVDNKLCFIGLSGKFATEKEGRDDAYRNALDNVVKFMGTFVKDRFQSVVTSYNLTSEIVDPTKATRQFEEQLSAAMATHVKPKDWYIEKWNNAKMNESYYLVYVMALVPKESIDKAYEDTVNGQIDDLKKKRDEANDEKAKAQFDNAMKAFEEVKKQGLSLEEKKPN